MSMFSGWFDRMAARRRTAELRRVLDSGRRSDDPAGSFRSFEEFGAPEGAYGRLIQEPTQRGSQLGAQRGSQHMSQHMSQLA